MRLFASSNDGFALRLIDEDSHECERLIKELDTLIGSYGPFVKEGIYKDLETLFKMARKQYLFVMSKRYKDSIVPPPPQFDSSEVPSTLELAEVRKRLFKSIADRVDELSQHERSEEPAS